MQGVEWRESIESLSWAIVELLGDVYKDVVSDVAEVDLFREVQSAQAAMAFDALCFRPMPVCRFRQILLTPGMWAMGNHGRISADCGNRLSPVTDSANEPSNTLESVR